MSSDDVPPPLAQLVSRLIERTDAGDVTWEATDVPGRYIAVFGSGTVWIDDDDGEGNAPFFLRILDRNGRRVEALNLQPEDYDATHPNYGVALNLAHLFPLAANSSRRVDPTVDAILRELGG